MNNTYIPKDDYAEINRLEKLGHNTEELTRNAIEKAGIKNANRILDVGCGIGTVSQYIASNYPDKRIVGVDISEKFIDEAKKKSVELGLKNTEYKVCNAENIPFDSDSFDLIICRFLLQHIKKWENVVQEFYRLLGDGGKIVIIETDWGGQFVYPPCKQYDFLNNMVIKFRKYIGVNVYIGRSICVDLAKYHFKSLDYYCDMKLYDSNNCDDGKFKIKERTKVYAKIAKKIIFLRPIIIRCVNKIHRFLDSVDFILTDCRFILVAEKKK